MEDSTISALRSHWYSLGIKKYGHWREMNKDLKRQTRLYVFRKRLVAAILRLMCGAARCKSFGSKKLTSDVDITISSRDIVSDLGVLQAIRIFMKLVFIDEDLFWFRGQFSVRHACDFFDINFYLSNFAMLRPRHDKNDYNSYYTTTDIDSELYYAFYDYKKNITVFNLEQYSAIAIYIKELLSKPYSQQISNEIVDSISKLSLYETECYHTQGAFVHIVLMKQRGIKLKNVPEHVYLASAIENLSFAHAHSGSRKKYLKRVIDAVSHIKNPHNALTRIDLTSTKRQIKSSLDALWSWKQISRQTKWTVTSR